tara:strand:+ start:996 stop:1406 length:411 start_codon:yes stop_codon:yes gene_type:complete
MFATPEVHDTPKREWGKTKLERLIRENASGHLRMTPEMAVRLLEVNPLPNPKTLNAHDYQRAEIEIDLQKRHRNGAYHHKEEYLPITIGEDGKIFKGYLLLLACVRVEQPFFCRVLFDNRSRELEVAQAKPAHVLH